MKYYIVKKKPKANECDAAPAVDAALGFGMGPVIVDGGPDRWDNVVWPVQTQAPVRTYRARKRKRKK